MHEWPIPRIHPGRAGMMRPSEKKAIALCALPKAIRPSSQICKLSLSLGKR